MNKQSFREALLSWYNEHKRDLPWRNSNDPYIIWISEIILQQTRVNQGLPYFQKFSKNYPTVYDLAEAPENRVMKDWEGLGYYSRARNLHSAAKQIVSEFNGNFPDAHAEILKLKGVGDYTAAAISSFAYNQPHAVVDGNVFRVLARVFGIFTPINTGAGKKQFDKLAAELLYRKDPATYNQAIMEFGALQCVPKSPDCEVCPLKNGCNAYINGTMDSLPVKEKKSYDRKRYFNFALIKSKNQVLVEPRTGQDIWKQLYQFPLVEHTDLIEPGQMNVELEVFMGKTSELTFEKVTDLPTHKLSHQTIYCRIFEISCKGKLKLAKGSGMKWVNPSELNELGFPRPLRKFLDRKQLTLPL